jgi:hypothetical protein
MEAGSDGGSGETGGGGDGSSDGVGGTTWTRDVQPLLWARCSDCHSTDGGQVPFTESYAVLWQPTQRRCLGETVGVCISHVLQDQVPEGSGCRTIEVSTFHRESWRPCLTPSEVRMVVDWVDAGMPL